MGERKEREEEREREKRKREEEESKCGEKRGRKVDGGVIPSFLFLLPQERERASPRAAAERTLAVSPPPFPAKESPEAREREKRVVK